MQNVIDQVADDRNGRIVSLSEGEQNLVFRIIWRAAARIVLAKETID